MAGFPVNPVNRTVREIINLEGDKSYSIAGRVNPGVPVVVGATLYTNTYNNANYIGLFSAVISVDGPCSVIVSQYDSSIAGTSLDRVTEQFRYYFGANGGTIQTPEAYLSETGQIGVTFTATTTSDCNIGVSYRGKKIVADANYNARYGYLQLTDSIGATALGLINGTGAATNVNPGWTAYARRMCNKLRSDGIDIRLIGKGVAGATLANYFTRAQSGAFDDYILMAGIIEIALGTNDASAGTAASQNYVANMQTLLNYIFMLRPDVSVILTSVGGTSVPAILGNSVGYRTALAGVPALYAGKDIKYFDRSVPTPNPSGASDPLFTETAANTQLHLRGDTGHPAVFSSLYPIVQTTNFWINR